MSEIIDDRETPPKRTSCKSEPPLSEAEEFRRVLEQFKAVLDSAAVQRVIEVFAKRVDAEPEKARSEIQLRQRVHEVNTRFYSTNRTYFLIGLGMCLLFIVGIIWMLRDDKETLLPVVTAVIGLLTGAGGGFIFGQSRRGTAEQSP